MLKQSLPGERCQRMPLEAEVLIFKRGESWDTRAIDISATGLLVLKPEDWADDPDAEYGLELILDEHSFAINGRVARGDDMGVAFEFTRIPAESEAPLWQLLGECADATELPEGERVS